MPLKSLEFLANKVTYETLPSNWNTLDLARFSPAKSLWDYQQQALKHAITILYKYYEEFVDYETNENAKANMPRKEKLYELYFDGIVLSAKERAVLNLSVEKVKLRDS